MLVSEACGWMCVLRLWDGALTKKHGHQATKPQADTWWAGSIDLRGQSVWGFDKGLEKAGSWKYGRQLVVQGSPGGNERGGPELRGPEVTDLGIVQMVKPGFAKLLCSDFLHN